MKDDPEVVRLVCRPHCRYYRPGQKEEMSCRGYDFWKEALLASPPGEILPPRLCHNLPLLLERLATSSPPAAALLHEDRLEALLCADCPFRPDGCDFHDPAVSGAVPCGGYVLLARLLAEEEAKEKEDEAG